MALSRLPQGITEAQIRLECARHGALTTVVLEDGGNGSGVTAYVCYASSDRAQYAVRKMTGAKIGLFGGEPVQVKLISELPESVTGQNVFSMFSSDMPRAVHEEMAFQYKLNNIIFMKLAQFAFLYF